MAHEFISQGHSKEEAYDMAINKFDIDNDVLKILCENAKENNKKLEVRNKIDSGYLLNTRDLCGLEMIPSLLSARCNLFKNRRKNEIP